MRTTTAAADTARRRWWSLAYSGTLPIQNIVLSPTSISYLRANVSLPSSPIRNRQARGYWLYCIAIPHIHRQIVLRHQWAPTRVNVKGTRVHLLGLDVLDRYGLADGLIDRVHDDAVFTGPNRYGSPESNRNDLEVDHPRHRKSI